MFIPKAGLVWLGLLYALIRLKTRFWRTGLEMALKVYFLYTKTAGLVVI